jgi:hypothetical protein
MRAGYVLLLAVVCSPADQVWASPPGLAGGLPPAREFRLPRVEPGEAAVRREPDGRIRAGVHRAVAPEFTAHGAWQTTADGRRVWRVRLRSAGAAGMRLRFSNFDVGAGQVWLHDGSDVAGPYTGRGIFGDGEFWSATLASEVVTLEYEPAPEGAAGPTLPFVVRAISHQAAAAERPLDLVAPVPDSSQAGTADYCQLDPNCYPEWRDTMRSVAQIAYEENGNRYLCSGALVATRDNSRRPYLLTAGHCIHDEAAARSLEVYWSYQTAACHADPPGKRESGPSSLGASYIASATLDQGDYSLVLLRDTPASALFATWDMSDPPQGTSLVGIHHPAGSYKRISFGVRSPDTASSVAGQSAPASRFLQVTWQNGRTEPGSSGSPLFSAPGVIVGMLSYGPASAHLSACQISPSVDGYGRFSNAYQQLRDWFENLPAAAVVPSAGEAAFTLRDGVLAPSYQAVGLTTGSTGQVSFKARADAPWIKLAAASGTLSASTPATLYFTIDSAYLDRPDTYSSTITILSGAAPPQYINVRVDTRRQTSRVTVAVFPNPVYEQAITPHWFLRLSLEEKAGVATVLTRIRLNGVEYPVAPWFGAGRLEALGRLDLWLQSDGPFSPGDQYFEFWGQDEGDGEPWYRLATVPFVPLAR